MNRSRPTKSRTPPAPRSGFLPGTPRLHYLEWNPEGRFPVVLLHGNTANAWWWEATARYAPEDWRMIALDLRGHGDSEWVRPPAYSPFDHAADLRRLIEELKIHQPLIVGHSMGGIAALAFALRAPSSARGIVAVDIALRSSPRRDRFLRRLKSLPTVTYASLDIAIARFRLMPQEGKIPLDRLAKIARHSLTRTEDGRYTFKFDRESFLGTDGLDVLGTLAILTTPVCLVRAQASRIMTVEASKEATSANPHVRLVELPDCSHHVPLEKPRQLAQVIRDFARSLEIAPVAASE